MEESNIKNRMKVYVTREEWVGNRNHPLKKHPLIKAAAAPTMAIYDGTACMLRMDDTPHFQDEETLNCFLNFGYAQ